MNNKGLLIMKKAILFLLLLATMPMQTTAQVNPRKGYVITNGNDTVHGTIDYLTDARNAKECLFQRRGEDAYKSLSPADIGRIRISALWKKAKSSYDGLNEKNCGILTIAYLFM